MSDPSDIGINDDDNDPRTGIFEGDDRYPINTFEEKPIRATVAVDTGGWGDEGNGNHLGSGILIGPSHVLTAGHNFHILELGRTYPDARVTLSENVAGIPDRRVGIIEEANTSGDPLFMSDYDRTRAPQDDIALAQLSARLLSPGDVMGMVAFLGDHRQLSEESWDRAITTAGYPFDLPTRPADSDDFPNDQKALYGASGSASRRELPVELFSFSEEVDAAQGQSGSGVWTTIDGSPDPLVAGVLTGGDSIGNWGRLITKDVYDAVVEDMADDLDDIDRLLLPENVIVGTDDEGDLILGSYRKERMIGNDGDDRMVGRGGDDVLLGGKGDGDAAEYFRPFEDYLLQVVDATVDPDHEFRIIHRDGGPRGDGTDLLRGVEFADFLGNFRVPLKVDSNDPTKIADGPMQPLIGDVIEDADGREVGRMSLEIPSWTVDGDVRYTLTLGSDSGITYNFAYIVDVSGSMAANDKIGKASEAYIELTNELIDLGIADAATFAVIPFNWNSTLYPDLTAQQAIDEIGSLSAGGGTRFGPAIQDGIDFFNNTAPGGTNIAFFLSDGQSNDANSLLQEVAEVRAFGLGPGARLDNLNVIDSDDAVLLTDPRDLFEGFTSAPIDSRLLDRVDVLLDGEVVDVIDGDDFNGGALGLTYDGEVDGLAVGLSAVNALEFRAIFNDGRPSASLNAFVTSGQDRSVGATPDGTPTVTLALDEESYQQADAAGAVIYANDIENEITLSAGANTVYGQGGEDRFIVEGGVNVIDGGDGKDVVQFNRDWVPGQLSKTGGVVKLGQEATLVDVEYASFANQLIDLSDLTRTGRITVDGGDIISIVEGDDGQTYAEIQLRLLGPSSSSARIAYETRDLTASAGSDFEAKSGNIIIPGGSPDDTFGRVRILIYGDDAAEGNERFEVLLTSLEDNDVFDGLEREVRVVVEIDDDDTSVSIPITGANPRITEGGPGVRTLEIEVTREGDLSDAAVIDFEIAPTGSTPARAADFNGAFPSGEVVFEPGQDSAVIAVDFVGNDEAGDGDRTFGISLSSPSGDVTTPPDPTVFIIGDDDSDPPTPIWVFDGDPEFQDASDVVEVPHRTEFERAEGTVALSFVADDVTGLHGLVSKDARDFGDGGHLSIYIEDGALVARLQSTDTSHVLRHEGVQSGEAYDVVLAFEEDGDAFLFVDGGTADAVSNTGFSLETNQERLQVGALGWASEPDDPGAFDYVFDGRIEDVRIFGVALDPSGVPALSTSSDDLWA